jgi:hypothetical protein
MNGKLIPDFIFSLRMYFTQTPHNRKTFISYGIHSLAKAHSHDHEKCHLHFARTHASSVCFISLLQVFPQQLLNNNTKDSTSKHYASPLIAQLLDLRPETVLLGAHLLERGHLVRIGGAVAADAHGFLLPVAAVVAHVDVVGDGAEEFDRGEHVGAVEQDGEGEVAEEVAEVAGFV